MKEKKENITANDFKFNFKIEGKLNKDIIQKNLTIDKEFELSEVDTKANCTFTIKPNQNANLSCDLNAENHKNVKNFSFKTSQIDIENHSIYLSKLNDILLINSENKEDDNNKETNDRSLKVIIILVIVCGVVAPALIGFILFFLVRKIINANKQYKLNKPIKGNKKILVRLDESSVKEKSSKRQFVNFDNDLKTTK